MIPGWARFSIVPIWSAICLDWFPMKSLSFTQRQPTELPRVPVLVGAAGGPLPWRRFLSFLGPGVLVAVGYMDPGNWATSLAGGSAYGNGLLCVVLASNALAMLFQAAAVRLGIGGGMDLAQACRLHFSRPVSFTLWLLCEGAIVACNLAEVIGMAIGLKLLLGIPLSVGVVVTFVDVMLILALQTFGFRYLQAVVASLVLVIGVCFGFQIAWLHPIWSAVANGFLPHAQIVTDPRMLYLAVGIIGATVMPHNLYLHSSVVRQGRHGPTIEDKRQAIRFATIDSNVALASALFINAAILIVAAGAFHRPNMAPVSELGQAYQLLSPLLGVGVASAVFGLALLCSGLSSSVTGTLAGQIVMDGFLRLRVSPTARAFVTRSLAIVPAMVAVVYLGDKGANSLLVFSQVVLSLQLPFAVVPLLLFTTSRKYLGPLAFRRRTSYLLWGAAITVTMFNGWLLLKVLS